MLASSVSISSRASTSAAPPLPLGWIRGGGIGQDQPHGRRGIEHAGQGHQRSRSARDQILRCRIRAQGSSDRAPSGEAIEHLASPFTGVAAGDRLQISQGLLAETALVGLGAVLQQPVKRFRQVADLQGWHEALKHRSTVGFMHALCM